MSSPPAWPFVNAFPVPIGDFDPLDPTALALLSLQAASAADGRVYTDLFPLKTWRQQSLITATPKNRSIVYDAKSRRWLVFALNGAVTEPWYTVSGSKWALATGTEGGSPAFTDIGRGSANTTGVIMMGGTPTTSSTKKLTESNDGGATWTRRDVGNADTQGVNCISHSDSLGIWIASIGGNGGYGIAYSFNRIAWSPAVSAGAPPTTFVRREAVAGVYGTVFLGVVLQVFPPDLTIYFRSEDGVHWTTEQFPATIASGEQPTFNAYAGVFVVSLFDGIYVSVNGKTGTWRRVFTTATTYVSFGSFGRALIRSDGYASVNVGQSWFPVLEVVNTDFIIRAVEGIGVMMLRPSTNTIYMSYLVGS